MREGYIGFALLHEKVMYEKNTVPIYVRLNDISTVAAQNIGEKTYTRIMLKFGRTFYVTEDIVTVMNRFK